jgi:hypothetical protein
MKDRMKEEGKNQRRKMRRKLFFSFSARGKLLGMGRELLRLAEEKNPMSVSNVGAAFNGEIEKMVNDTILHTY